VLAALAGGFRGYRSERFLERDPIWQAGQTIVGGRVGQLALQRTARADVLEH